jgi:hypothetical protein
MHVHRDAAPVVGHGDGRIRMNDDFNTRAYPSQGLVNRVVHHFIDKVVQGFDVCAAHVHARAAPDGLQSFQDLDILCVITLVGCHYFLNSMGIAVISGKIWRSWVGFARPTPPIFFTTGIPTESIPLVRLCRGRLFLKLLKDGRQPGVDISIVYEAGSQQRGRDERVPGNAHQHPPRILGGCVP